MDAPNNHQNRRICYIGFEYYVLTWACYERQFHFTHHDRVDLVREQMFRTSRETNVADIAHCFMPDHVHQLVKGTTVDADARLYMRKAKQYSGFYFMNVFHVKLWGGKGFDRFVRDAYQYRAAVKYIIENPLRAGLVKRVEDYAFTGSSQHTIKELMEIAYPV